jgi:hypothetical protein
MYRTSAHDTTLSFTDYLAQVLESCAVAFRCRQTYASIAAVLTTASITADNMNLQSDHRSRGGHFISMQENTVHVWAVTSVDDVHGHQRSR